MAALRVEPFEGRPLLDIASFGRTGLGKRERLTTAQVALILRTVNRAPEVMVKVLTRNSNDLASVRRHLEYIGRDGNLDLETDDGEHVGGKQVGRELVDDWNLDLENRRAGDELKATSSGQPPKLVHKLIFSMPAGTPPKAVLSAARNFLREEFGLKHRYVLALHTDEPHPHVHAVVKAISEGGVRLNIRKAMLRRWRSEFARYLRAEGVAANATERAVRGQVRKAKLDPIYRAMEDPARESTFLRDKVEAVANALARSEQSQQQSGKVVRATRAVVTRGWQGIADWLEQARQPGLSEKVRQFMGQMSPARSDAESIATQLAISSREQRRREPERLR